MAGACRPTGMKKEIKIEALEYRCHCDDVYGYDYSTSGLVQIVDANYQGRGIFLDTYYGQDYFRFKITSPGDIWAISYKYTDSGGETNKPVILYKEANDKTQLLGTFPTINASLGRKYNVWYKLFESLEAGTYRVIPTGRYSAWNEWFAEGKNKELYLKNDAAYGMQA